MFWVLHLFYSRYYFHPKRSRVRPSPPSVSATKTDSRTVVILTISVDSTGTGGETLIRDESPSAGEIRVGTTFAVCTTASPSSMAGCTALGGVTTTASTSSNSVMQIVSTYPSQAFNGFLDLQPSKPHQMVVVSFSFANNSTATSFVSVGTTGQTPSQELELSSPAKYSGPEFSGLSTKGITTGSSPRLEGKNLDEISSIEIGGKAATFRADGESALELTLRSGLAPGLYDLVINSSAGKLTHINAIRVREPLKSFSITSRSTGKISEEQYQEHAIISSMQVPELTKARCVVNASSLAMAKAQAQRLCALVKAANPNIDTTIVEARSTVKDDSVFARVSYGLN